jgi:molybdenum cofactor cytidylyltransferase
MKLSDALRVQPGECISFSGSGGKTSALVALAQELENPVIATTTTHFSKEQIGFADRIIYSSDVQNSEEFVESAATGVTLLLGEDGNNNRVSGPPPDQLNDFYQHARSRGINLLVEADGSRQRALKAPAAHEPAIPPFTDQAVVVAGLSGLGKPLISKFVHRIDEYRKISGLVEGDEITQDAIYRVLTGENGGLKGIPEKARRICLLNQADDVNLQAKAKRLANSLKTSYDSVVVTSFLRNQNFTHKHTPIDGYIVYGVHEPITGIVLAAGGSERMGRPKQLLSWKGSSLIQYIVSTVINAGMDHTLVVLGAFEDRVREEINNLPVEIVVNPQWEAGQSTSVQAGISAVPENSGSVIIFLVDQPHLSKTLIRSLVERHAETLSPIIAPIVAGQRGNPVLFDRSTFDKFLAIHGDAGGRQIFSQYQVSWITWHDEAILFDIDTDEDYCRLLSDSGEISEDVNPS